MICLKFINEVTKERWLKETFPEWGNWLIEEIEDKQVPENSFAMWWLGCTGIWLKTHENTNIVMDMWNGTGKRSHGNGKMRDGVVVEKEKARQTFEAVERQNIDPGILEKTKGNNYKTRR